jgi:nitrogenase subunit NifH
MNIYNNLPEDLQYKITSHYIFSENKNKLLKDIIQYKKQKEEIYNLYSKNGFIYNLDFTDDNNIYAWVENDLMAYYNDNKVYMDIITDNNKNKMSRQLIYNIKKNIEEKNAIYNYHLNNKINIIAKINRYIANLTIDERIDFIENHEKSINAY